LTFGFSSLSSPPWNGVLTKLKKYRCPIQVMPARMWNHRKMAWRVDSISGNMALSPLEMGRSGAAGTREGDDT
jgi:hypothetical protein